MGSQFEYIKDRLKDEGVKVAQTYLTTYPADIFSGVTPQQSETTSGCGLLYFVGENKAKFMTYWGYRLNDVIENEATRLGWYPVTGLPEAFQGHGYCAYIDNKITCSDGGSVPCSPLATGEQVVDESWFDSWSESESTQNDKDGTLHPNLQGHTAWKTRYLAAIAAPSRASTGIHRAGAPMGLPRVAGPYQFDGEQRRLQRQLGERHTGEVDCDRDPVGGGLQQAGSNRNVSSYRQTFRWPVPAQRVVPVPQ